MNSFTKDRNNWREELKMLVKSAVIHAGSSHALARSIGVSYQTVLSWQRGATPNDENLHRLEKFVAAVQKREVTHD